MFLCVVHFFWVFAHMVDVFGLPTHQRIANRYPLTIPRSTL
jgi:hypothetical protein